jgi:aminoglycoside N3'-acetyltransferase
VYAEADRQRLIRRHQIGNAICQLFKARAMVTIFREWRRSDPFGLFEVPR